MNYFDIVIVNWNSGSKLSECVTSINLAKKTKYNLDKIIIVDNNSSDNSIKNLCIANDKLKIILSRENLGFARACNIGAELAENDFIIFINPDIIVFEDTFDKLFNFIIVEGNSNDAVFGIQLLTENNSIQRSCAQFPTPLNFICSSLGLNKINSKVFKSYTMEYWDHKQTMQVDQVIGAFFTVKNTVFRELNGFDERFFVYYEELDFSKRVAINEYKSIYVVESSAMHIGCGTTENIKAKRLFYNLNSRILYCYKYFPYWQAFIIKLVTLLFEPLTRLVYVLSKGKWSDFLAVLAGFSMLYQHQIKKYFK